jgi:hypothetical protein
MRSKRERLHDLKAVHMNLTQISRLLKAGYRFEGEEGDAVLAELDRKSMLLGEELKLLSSEWASAPSESEGARQ